MATEYADFLLSNGDLDLSGSDISLIDSNLISLKQRLDLRFAVWQAEWKYDESYGTPYRDYIGIAKDKSTIDQEIKRQILKEPDVVEISSLTSSINKKLRLYTFLVDVSTNEATLTYSLNLKDSFEYEIPAYSSGCDKIVEYQYWTSAPYDYLHIDRTDSTVNPLESSLLDPVKTSDMVVVSTNALSGTLKDSIKFDSPIEEFTTNSFNLSAGIINSTFDGYLRLGEAYTTSGYTLVSGELLTYEVINTNEDENYTTSSYNLVSGTVLTT